MTASFFNIGRLRIFLYAALPGFGTLATSVAILTPYGDHSRIIMNVNIVPSYVYQIFFDMPKYRDGWPTASDGPVYRGYSYLSWETSSSGFLSHTISASF